MKWEAEAFVSVVRSTNISGSDEASLLLCAIASWNDVVEDQIVAKTVDMMITYVLVIWKLVDSTASLPTKIVTIWMMPKMRGNIKLVVAIQNSLCSLLV